MAQFLRWYSKKLYTHPWKTQLLTTALPWPINFLMIILSIHPDALFTPSSFTKIDLGFLMGTSDFISQTAIERKEFKQIELLRIGRFAFIGTFFVAPVIRTWYNFLEKAITSVGRTVGLRKVIIDQMCFSPFFLGGFLTVSGLLQFQPWPIIKAKIHEDYFRILLTNYKLWPAAQLITFYVIPLEYRIIFVSFVALLWNTYLSSQANKSFITPALSDIDS